MNRNTIFLAALVAALTAAVAFVFSGKLNPTTAPGVTRIIRPLSPGDRAPSFTLPDVRGGTVSLDDYRGKVVLVNFWSTSCYPCKEEIPDFVTLQTRYEPRGLQVIGIGLDEPAALREYAEKAGMNYVVVPGTNEVAWRFGGISGVPRTFVIHRGGTIVNIYSGPRSLSQFEDEVRRLLE